jgi:hypothetical protein
MASRSAPDVLSLAQRHARTRGLAAAAVLGCAAVWPAAHAEDGPVVCPFRLMTGLPCPLCGMTRSFVYTVHGRLDDAFAAHLFGPALVLLFALWAVTGRRHAGTAADPERWWAAPLRPVALVVCGAWVSYAVLRIAV